VIKGCFIVLKGVWVLNLMIMSWLW